MERKTEIEIELNETIAYKPRREMRQQYCPRCGSQTDMATPLLAAVTAQLTEREIFRLVEAGEVHFVETDGIFICMESIRR